MVNMGCLIPSDIIDLPAVVAAVLPTEERNSDVSFLQETKQVAASWQCPAVIGS